MISPFLSDEDIKRITKLGYKEENFVQTFRNKRFMKLVDGKCIFLDNKNKIANCKIYKTRPETCRLYPTEIRDDGDCRPEMLKFDK